MNIQNPPGGVISIEAQKAAFDNGYRIEEGIKDGWLHYRSSTVPGDIAIASSSDQGPWHLRISQNSAIAELKTSTFSFNNLAELYSTLDKVYRLSASLPDVPLQKFQEEKAKLPQTTEAERLVVQRVGQNLFRDALIKYWDGRCPLTGITDTPLLRASHIVSWAECESDAQRLDVHNGLLLSALWDAAFDKGLVSFGDDGTVLTSPNLSVEAKKALQIEGIALLLGLTELHHKNLAIHRKKYGFK
ncbi:MAG TPA: HNH endonuclease [Alphaproteobacteria bacterium]|nr:HNH endonuclease [Alphaproteobacteria bacterium]